MKFINGTITEQEQSELNGLINTTKEVRKPSVLQDYIKHDELFRAYPFLKTVDVEFDTSMQKGEHGKYTPSLNTITLNAYDSSNQIRVHLYMKFNMQYSIMKALRQGQTLNIGK